MPYESDKIKLDRAKSVLSRLRTAIYEPLGDLNVTAWVTREPVPYSERESGERLNALKPGDRWAELWDCAWFRFEGRVPECAAGRKVVLLLDINGEMCVVDRDGHPYQGLTTVNSTFDYSLGLPGKRVVDVSDSAAGGEVVDLWADAGCNDLFGSYHGGLLKEACMAICNENYRQLYYDFEVLIELAEQLPEASARKAQVLQSLYEASLILAGLNEDSVDRAAVLLSAELQKRGGDASLSVSAIGHAHIDLAWLWPIRETIRKGARTFATALRNMEKYPDYTFGASQPQLYQWVKDDYPALYAQVKERIREGRWEAQGAMWVEPDTNISGGEALIRQILYGKRFFQQEFGQDMKVLWLPDVFGYSGSLPQLLRKSGIDYMMTQKLSWSVYNTHPHHSFHWEGIDGTRVLTHLPPEDTYNSPAAPRSLAKIESQYLDRNVSGHALMLFGIGDGGGGPGEEHLERLSREKDLSGLPPVVQESSLAFFRKLEKEAGKFQTYRGELYLEKHQGTLTTQARNKRYNRKLEKELRDLEWLASLQWAAGQTEYPSDSLERIWKEVLLYQFHDILPGSSIARVYDESLDRYAALTAEVREMKAQACAQLAGSAGWDGEKAVFNSLPWERREWIQAGGDGSWRKVVVPGMSYCRLADATVDAVVPALTASERQLENELLKVSFNEEGHIVSVFDKPAGREAILPGAAANVFTVYHDDGDAWDFPRDYRDRAAGQMKLAKCSAYVEGPRAVLEQRYTFGESELIQKIILTSSDPVVRFETEADWKQSHSMLRVSFPVSVYSNEVSCDIQFGTIKRPTTRNTMIEFAKDEICAHHYIDLSQPDYGVALLNDCKYGHSVQGHVMDLNLLRSPDYPDPTADRARHQFVYALYPHVGDAIQAEVGRKGYELNVPLTLAEGKMQQGRERCEPVTLIRIDHPHVMLESVKKAEDSDHLILRLYETAGANAQADIAIGLACECIEESDLMEQPLHVLQEGSSWAALSFAPFEIKTLRVKLAGPQ
ncbi:alpha-mannosidase [Cohnella candidum]|uniref:Alpha-mannosidase n=1 Tax=Cohnella candidum TaxID=2674991 RepID=A0A3G3JYR2_9BACL|nr:glycoside hydrolase family 38 C-terminal domain-containing protein [Cohnella candidum]AYQ73333.1 alpha-mannosidase [Cohnella candidum]